MAGSLLNGMLLFFLLGISSALPSPSSSSSSSPWMDTSLCPLTDSLMMCQLKKGICSPINTIFSPAGGPVKAITTCANSTGAVLGPQFFMSVGLSFLSGSPESLADKASSDPAVATAIRRCALNATGLLNPDLLTLNRTAVSNSLSSAFITPELGDAVAAAVTTCPEPINYKVADFMNCLKVACMNNVAVTPFMNQATSALTGAGPLVAASPPAAAAKKPVTPKNTGSAAPPSSGSSAYSAGAYAYPGAGGAFPYAGAGSGAGGAPAASGSSAYMAGAGGSPPASGPAPYMAGAGSGAGGAPAASGSSAYMAGAGGSPPASGPAPYMAGAFPYAGAGGGFPYAGAGSGASGAGAIPYAGGAGGAGAGAFPYPSSSGGASAPQSSSSANTVSSK